MPAASFKHRLARLPVVGGALVFAYRSRAAASYLGSQLRSVLHWLATSRETTNFTYDLEPNNRRYLAALVADITGITHAAALGYMDELENDAALRAHIATVSQASAYAHVADTRAMFGKRLCWYVLVRATKPATVVETGVDKGLGACVLTAALMRNTAEGHRGLYLGTDINPDAGFLLCGPYAAYGRLLIGDSIASLRQLDAPVDLFINDSSRAAQYEAEEYAVVAPRLSPRAIILSDNARDRDTLLDFSLRTQRHFVFFQERPLAHWYAGSGVGISFRR